MVWELCARIYGYMLWRKYRISDSTNMKNTVQQRLNIPPLPQLEKENKQPRKHLEPSSPQWLFSSQTMCYLLYNNYIIFMYFIIPDERKKNCRNKMRILDTWGFIFDWINIATMDFRGTLGGLMRLHGCPQTESCAVNSDAQDALGRKVKILFSSKPKSCKTHWKQNPSSVSI